MLQLKQIAWDLPNGVGILKGIDLTVEDGKLVVVTGPNGGGKTTLAKVIAGLETPTAGQILLDGEDITALDTTARARKGIGICLSAASPLQRPDGPGSAGDCGGRPSG